MLNQTEESPLGDLPKTKGGGGGVRVWRAQSGRSGNFVNCIINKIYLILFDAGFGRFLYDYYVFNHQNFRSLFSLLTALPGAKLRSNTKFRTALQKCH